MRSVKYLLAAGAASLFSSMAFAADMPIAPPPMYTPPPPADFGGWYLRGDIGMTNQSMKSLHSTSIDAVNASYPGSLQDNGFGFDSSTLYRLGVGYQFNNWFRTDFTAEYRGRSNLHGSQSVAANSAYGIANNQFFADNYSGSKSEWVVMANAYADLGTWWCVTPYVGAGLGAAYNHLSGFRDDGVISTGGVQSTSVTYAGDAGKWNLAWAVYAGLAYRVTPNVTLDLGYRYIDLGSATTGASHSFDGVTVVNGSAFTVRDITSHDLMLGVRWELESPPVYAPPPLIRKG